MEGISGDIKGVKNGAIIFFFLSSLVKGGRAKGFCNCFAEAIGYELKGDPSKPNKAAIHAEEMMTRYPFLCSLKDL